MNCAEARAFAISHFDLGGMASEVLERGGCFRFRAHGRSMWPFVRSGDALLIQPLGDSKIVVGDILLYRGPSDRLVAHRVVGFTGEAFVLRGDRLRAPEELVQRPQILGRVVAIERRGRRISIRSRRLLAKTWIFGREVLRSIRRLR